MSWKQTSDMGCHGCLSSCDVDLDAVANSTGSEAESAAERKITKYANLGT